MLIYIWFRFNDIRFATSAILALVHDVLVVLTCYSLLRISVGSTFIACMLTIIGYSINDTIVVFDRIRETLKNVRTQDEAALKEIADKSINQTISRSINTSLTTFVMVFLLWLLFRLVTAVQKKELPKFTEWPAGLWKNLSVTDRFAVFYGIVVLFPQAWQQESKEKIKKKRRMLLRRGAAGAFFLIGRIKCKKQFFLLVI